MASSSETLTDAATVTQQDPVSLEHHTSASSVSSSASGGGPPDLSSAAARAAQVNTTPPSSSLQGKKIPAAITTFSPSLCLGFIDGLTPEQLNFERQYFELLGQPLVMKNTRNTTAEKIRQALKQHLQGTLLRAFTSVVEHSQLTPTFSCTNELTTQGYDAATPPTTTQHSVTVPRPAPTQQQVTADKVCQVLSSDTVSFSNLDVTAALSLCDTWQKVGTRYISYFGSSPYSYGKTKHAACDYPDSPIFTQISERLAAVFPDFSLADYTCLLTHYPDGKSSIPLHSDDETQIQAGSNIITISVGAPRDLTLRNLTGIVRETTVHLPHGSVHIMPQEHQSVYQHGIRPDSSITEPRVSFTFRKLLPARDLPVRTKVPPIQHPDKYRSPAALPVGTHDRVLFLTDSVLSATPPFIFERDNSTVLIKKTCWQLTNVAGFEPEFSYTKTVIISCGVNDLSRHGLRAPVLADLFCRRLADWCKRHPSTNFVFNSLLETNINWLNTEINQFNQIIHELSLKHSNLHFYDSHELLVADKISEKRENVIEPTGNGIHITKRARIVVNDGLVDAVAWLHAPPGGAVSSRIRNFRWPLRPSFHRHHP